MSRIRDDRSNLLPLQYIKGKVHPRTGNRGPEGEKRYSSTLSLTSALDGGGWATPHPSRFTPRKDPVHTVLEAGCASEPVWTGAEYLAPTRIQSADRQAHTELLYRLRYRSYFSTCILVLIPYSFFWTRNLRIPGITFCP
jgi:hypothetical protein